MLPAITARQRGGGQGDLDPLTLGFNPPYPHPIFPPYPRPLFFFIFFVVPSPKIQIFCPRPSDPLPIFHQNTPFPQPH